MRFIKRFLIKVFDFENDSEIIRRIKKKQKDDIDNYWLEIRVEELTRLKREHKLDLDEKDSFIQLLEQRIQSFKDKENEVYEREFLAKQQIKENHIIVQGLSSKMSDFSGSINKIYGEILGLQDIVDEHKKKIEKKPS